MICHLVDAYNLEPGARLLGLVNMEAQPGLQPQSIRRARRGTGGMTWRSSLLHGAPRWAMALPPPCRRPCPTLAGGTWSASTPRWHHGRPPQHRGPCHLAREISTCREASACQGASACLPGTEAAAGAEGSAAEAVVVMPGAATAVEVVVATVGVPATVAAAAELLAATATARARRTT